MRQLITAAALMMLPTWGQSTLDDPHFETATAKASASKEAVPGKGKILPTGEVVLPNLTLKELIMVAYTVQPDLVTGGPPWLASERFDVAAKAPPATPETKLIAMLQRLLADRFKLAIHRENKVMPVYALVVAKGAPLLPLSIGGGRTTCVWVPGHDGLRRRECHNLTMAQFTSQLPGWDRVGLDRPVVDLTGLNGAYEIHFEMGPRTTGTPAASPTIFDAMAQIGMKLEDRKFPVPVIVVDHAERINP
jgi:uncharacterized protein (TIGR03435 family)